MKIDKKKIIPLLSISVITITFIFSVLILNQGTVLTAAQTGEMNNKKIGWGIKRADNHEQPDVGSVNKKSLEEEEGICLGNKDKKYIYLTFDEGYEAGYTEKILDTLKENEVKATFFITAHYLNTQPDLVKRMVEEGHIVGNHTVNHKSMPDLSDEQVKKEVMDLHTAIYEKIGYEMKYIRPPKGEYSQRTLKLCKDLGYKTVMWSFAYVDWDEKQQKGNEYATKTILNNLHPGEVMLLHGNSKNNTEVLGSIIQEARKEGYEFKSLDEFVR